MPDTHTAPTILIVDDDANNIDILEMDLEEEGYHILKACDGVEGWAVLQEHKQSISLILLDRMMPNMDGMEFMAKMKADLSVARIPVIMQTAAAEREQVMQGIQAGVYYYLTKPYDPEMMRAIVRAALKDYQYIQTLVKESQELRDHINIIRECHFTLNTLDEAQYLSRLLANFFPDPERVILGITELLINAIEHGNLGISYEDKTHMMKKNTWNEQVTTLLGKPEYSGKKVHIHFKREENAITLTIEDEGDGFNWQDFIEISPDRATHIHGRGIALARMLSFDDLAYNDTGNRVTCTVNL